MFAILQIDDSKSVFCRSKISSERITLPSGEAFFIVNVVGHKGKGLWKKLERCLGVLGKDVLLPEEISIPEDVDITRFSPEIFPRILLINSSIDYLQKNKTEYLTKRLTVFDEDGLYAGFIEKFIPCFKSIRIISENKKLYENIAGDFMERYGFSLLLTDKESFDSDVIISDKCIVPVYFGGRILTNEKKYIMNTKTISGSEIQLPDLYEKLRPDNIGRLIFAAALYEKCAVTELTDMKYENFGC